MTTPLVSHDAPGEHAGGGLGESADGRASDTPLAPAPVAAPVSPPLASGPAVIRCAASVPTLPQTRVVVHWTGRKAYALRIAMRLSIHDFAAKLGISITTVHSWQEDSTGRLRLQTYQLLDTMLSLATEDDVRRFDLALREMGETQRS